MYGLLSFRFLSVIRQTFWGLQYPFITIKITPFAQVQRIALLAAEAVVQRGKEPGEVVHLLRAVRAAPG
jgi:hypothetical protein